MGSYLNVKMLKIKKEILQDWEEKTYGSHLVWNNWKVSWESDQENNKVIKTKEETTYTQ